MNQFSFDKQSSLTESRFSTYMADYLGRERIVGNLRNMLKMGKTV